MSKYANWRHHAFNFLQVKFRKELVDDSNQLNERIKKLTREILFRDYINNPDMEILLKYGMAVKPVHTRVTIWSEKHKCWNIWCTVVYCETTYNSTEISRDTNYDFFVPKSHKESHLYIGGPGHESDDPALLEWAKDFIVLRDRFDLRDMQYRNDCYNVKVFKTPLSLINIYPELKNII